MIADTIYLDSAPIIYFLDDIPPYNAVVQQIITDGIINNIQFVSSALLNTEYLVYPYRQHNTEKIIVFEEFKRLLKLDIFPVTENIATVAAQLRAKYAGLKGMDAVHLATAIESNSDAFITNDKQLVQITEVPMKLLDELL